MPTASDHVIITNGSVSVPADGAFAILDWSAGDISGTLVVGKNSVVNWAGGTLIGASQVIGTMNWSGGTISTAGLTVNSGGVFQIDVPTPPTGDLNFGDTGMQLTLNNGGTLRGGGFTLDHRTIRSGVSISNV